MGIDFKTGRILPIVQAMPYRRMEREDEGNRENRRLYKMPVMVKVNDKTGPDGIPLNGHLNLLA